MYNTQFKVKYNDIEQELTNKMKNTKDDDYEYSMQDVIDICNKLYKDELLSVFGLDEFDDCKFNQCMIHIYDIMMKNDQIKQIILNMEAGIMNEIHFNNTQQIQDSIRQVILLGLFSQNIFYIFHKCICQQIETGTIDDELIDDLRIHSIDLLKNFHKL